MSNGAKAAAWVDGNLVAQPAADVEGTADAVKFVLGIKSSDTNSKSFDIDYLTVWKDRND